MTLKDQFTPLANMKAEMNFPVGGEKIPKMLHLDISLQEDGESHDLLMHEFMQILVQDPDLLSKFASLLTAAVLPDRRPVTKDEMTPRSNSPILDLAKRTIWKRSFIKIINRVLNHLVLIEAILADEDKARQYDLTPFQMACDAMRRFFEDPGIREDDFCQSWQITRTKDFDLGQVADILDVALESHIIAENTPDIILVQVFEDLANRRVTVEDAIHRILLNDTRYGYSGR